MDVFELNKLPEVIALLVKAVEHDAGKVAEAVASQASDLCPVASGFLQSTIYVVTPDNDTYGQGVGSPPGDAYLLPEETPEKGESLVGVAANYGVFVESGTRHMPAQPFISPAAESVGQNFESHFSDVETFITEQLR